MIILSVSLASAVPAVSPDLEFKNSNGEIIGDFSPGEDVYISGVGFQPNTLVSIKIVRPDDSTDSALVVSDGSGEIEYIYDLNGILGYYYVYANDGVNNVVEIFSDSPGDHLVGYWNFDSTFDDKSGNDNHGTEMGDASLVSGKYGNAVSLDGSGDYVDIGTSPVFDIDEEVTLEAWVKPANPAHGWDGIISKPDTPAGKRIYGLFLRGGQDLFRFGVTNAADNFGFLEAGIPSYNSWYHVVGIYNGTVRTLYVNGALASESSDLSGLIKVNSSEPVKIGRWDGATNTDFEGLIDEVRIWNKSLSQGEIQGLMQGPSCGNGILETGEECDDDNNADGDGCSASCVLEEDICDGADYIFEFAPSMNVVGEGDCHWTDKIQDSREINLAGSGTFEVYATSVRGRLNSTGDDLCQGQTGESFFLSANGQDSDTSADNPGLGSCDYEMRTENLGTVPFNLGSNTLFMNTASSCPPHPLKEANSVDVTRVCLFKKKNGDDPWEFCAQASCGIDCYKLDYLGNEPDKEYPNDCKVVIPLRNGIPQQPKCVPTEIKNNMCFN
tara:strand:+ start:6376 stop:8040 length:1665 start_codon:yes stop_codon:yes gene_type:complete